jgi:hypothetical protein
MFPILIAGAAVAKEQTDTSSSKEAVRDFMLKMCDGGGGILVYESTKVNCGPKDTYVCPPPTKTPRWESLHCNNGKIFKNPPLDK